MKTINHPMTQAGYELIIDLHYFSCLKKSRRIAAPTGTSFTAYQTKCLMQYS